MKRIIIKEIPGRRSPVARSALTALCLVLTVTLCAGLVSCGSSGKKDESSSGDTPSDKTIEEIVGEVPDAKSEIEKQAEASDMTVTFDGDTVIYTYKYEETLSAESIATMAPALEKAMNEKRSDFVDLANTISRRTTRDDVIVRIRFVDAAGTEVYSVDFAEDASASSADSASSTDSESSADSSSTADSASSGNA